MLGRAHLSLAENIRPRPVEILDVETVNFLRRRITLAAVARDTLRTLIPRLDERLNLRTQTSSHSLRKILEPRNAVIQEIERIVHTQAEHHALLRRRHPVRVAETLPAVPLVIADTQQLPELLLLLTHLLRNLETTRRLIRRLRRSHRLRMVSKRSLALAAELTHQTLQVHAVNRPLRPLAAAPAFPRRLEIIPLQHRRSARTRPTLRPISSISLCHLAAYQLAESARRLLAAHHKAALLPVIPSALSSLALLERLLDIGIRHIPLRLRQLAAELNKVNVARLTTLVGISSSRNRIRFRTFPAIRLHISRQSINFAPGNV